MRDLRLGKFDVLVGINLLREGLDMPEVSLVAILDADKEGFLRSDRSLIQTIGRAARNLTGKAILYADKITGSMQRAIDETERRREKQQAHNQLNNIVPTGISKSITDIMEGARNAYEPSSVKLSKVAEKTAEYTAMNPKDIGKKIRKLEQQMYEHAKNLEFEAAANIRDELHFLQTQITGIDTD